MENQKTSKFLVFLQDVNYEDTFTPDMMDQLTKAHVDHIRDMDVKGILFFCGVVKGTEKGMLIFNANTYQEVEGYIQKDPFIAHKCYKTYVIQELEEANAGNNYLLDDHTMA